MMLTAFRFATIALLLLGFAGTSAAQNARALDTHLKVTGMVLDAKKGKPIKEAKVELYTQGKLIETVVIDKKGSFELILAFDKTHEVQIKADGYVTQRWKFDTRSLSSIDKQYDYEYNGVNARLYEEVEGTDYGVFDMAVQSVKFDKAQEGFFSDEAHEAEREQEFELFLKELRGEGDN